jgi:hypothetical protein
MSAIGTLQGGSEWTDATMGHRIRRESRAVQTDTHTNRAGRPSR